MNIKKDNTKDDSSLYGISWQLKKRFQFIEWHLMWERKFNARPLMEYFGISRYQATKDLKNYIIYAPNNVLSYDHLSKCYRPTTSFSPIFTNESPEEYLRTINDISDHEGAASIGEVPKLIRHIETGVLPSIMLSIDSKMAIDINYASANSPSGKNRRVWPTTLVYASNRLHLRAYCNERLDYRDFNVSRILSVPCITDIVRPPVIDVSWETKIEIKLVPNPALSNDARKLIAREFNLKKGVRVLNLRAALVQYFIQDNLLPCTNQQIEESKDKPWKFPLKIEDLEALVPWIF